VIAIALVSALYWLAFPPPARKQMRIVPGAVLAVALIVLLGWGYGTWITHVGTGGAYLAGLAVVGVTMITLYLFSFAILLGAELDRVLGARRARRLPRA
jgi:membrane protein